MRKLIVLVLVTAMLPVLALTGRAEAAAALPRAMWLWSRADPAAVVTWAKSQKIGEIYAYVPPNVAASGDLPRLKKLKSLADAAKIKLSALGGDPAWTFDAPAALAWQRAALATGLFAGSHVDIEPYALDSWTSDRDGTARAYLDVLAKLQNADSRPLEIDVPFWFDQIALGSSDVAARLLPLVNAVTVMSYRDTVTGPNSVMDVSASMLGRARAARKPVRLAVETQRLADCLHCSFYEEGAAALAAALPAIDAKAGAYSTYAGVAVHHYGSWTALKR